MFCNIACIIEIAIYLLFQLAEFAQDLKGEIGWIFVYKWASMIINIVVQVLYYKVDKRVVVIQLQVMFLRLAFFVFDFEDKKVRFTAARFQLLVQSQILVACLFIMLIAIAINNTKFRAFILMINIIIITLAITSSSKDVEFDTDTFLKDAQSNMSFMVTYCLFFSLIVGGGAKVFLEYKYIMLLNSFEKDKLQK